MAKSKSFGIVYSLAPLTKGLIYLDCVIFNISPPLNWNLKILQKMIFKMTLKIDSAKHLFKEQFEDCEHFFGLVNAHFGISHVKKRQFSMSRTF